MDVVPFYRNWRENETTWQLKPKRTAAASRGFLAGSTAFLFHLLSRFPKVNVSPINVLHCSSTLPSTHRQSIEWYFFNRDGYLDYKFPIGDTVIEKTDPGLLLESLVRTHMACFWGHNLAPRCGNSAIAYSETKS